MHMFFMYIHVCTMYIMYLVMKAHLDCIIIFLSEKMCSCWRVSTMCFLRKHFSANDLVWSDFNFT